MTSDIDTMTQEFEQILGDHRHLQEVLQATRDFLNAPDGPSGPASTHEWSAALAAKILQLHDLCYRHFRAEESSGTFEEIVRRFPRANRMVALLSTEHDRILANLRALLAAAMVYSENKAAPHDNLRQWALSVLDQLDAHEREETNYIQQLHYTDIGTGD